MNKTHKSWLLMSILLGCAVWFGDLFLIGFCSACLINWIAYDYVLMKVKKK